VSTWKLELPSKFRQFDYNTISDVVLHVRYTARQGGAQLREKAVEHVQEFVEHANTPGLVQLFSLKHDFSSEWHQFIAPDNTEYFTATVNRDYFPYFTQGRSITIYAVELCAIDLEKHELKPSKTVRGPNLGTGVSDDDPFELSLAPDGYLKREKDALVFVLLRYSIS